MKKLSGLALRWFILTIILCCLIIGYWIFSALYVYTGDAFLNIYPYPISSDISGTVEKVLVHESQVVKKGQLLFTLKDTSYLSAFNQASANLETAKLSKQQIQQTISAYEKLYKASNLEVKHFRNTWKAMKSLTKGLSQQARLDAQYAYDTARIDKQRAWINWQEQIFSLTPQGKYPAEEYARAVLDKARSDLGDTRTYAPSDGVISNISLKHKQNVAAGQDLFAVINFQKGVIRARLKESYVGRVHVGDRVTVTLRMYPFTFLHGTIETIGYGVNRLENSADVTSSALPYMSQAEDWIQLDQRFPVFIRLDSVPKGIKQRVGASARVLIHRHSSDQS
jgi:membrane fusion protein, multidrug efflux system